MNPLPLAAGRDDCWNRVGVRGEDDRKPLGFQDELELLRLRRTIFDNKNPRHDGLFLEGYANSMSWSAMDGSGRT